MQNKPLIGRPRICPLLVKIIWKTNWNIESAHLFHGVGHRPGYNAALFILDEGLCAVRRQVADREIGAERQLFRDAFQQQ